MAQHLESALLSRGQPFFRSLRPRGPMAGAAFELLTNGVGRGEADRSKTSGRQSSFRSHGNEK